LWDGVREESEREMVDRMTEMKEGLEGVGRRGGDWSDEGEGNR